jgi:cytochrome c biogenesis protein CcmG, thiol:disulfide interchange protein DsbE
VSVRRMRMAGLTVLVVVALAALAVFGLAGDRSVSGRKAPALPAESLSGSRVTLASMSASDGGKPFVVVFWASWCGPCNEEAPALESFARSVGGRGRIVGVDWSDARSGAVAFVHDHGWSFPVVRDAEGTVGNDYRIGGLPSTFVVDGGRIERTLVGPQTRGKLEGALRSAESA